MLIDATMRLKTFLLCLMYVFPEIGFQQVIYFLSRFFKIAAAAKQSQMYGWVGRSRHLEESVHATSRVLNTQCLKTASSYTLDVFLLTHR